MGFLERLYADNPQTSAQRSFPSSSFYCLMDDQSRHLQNYRVQVQKTTHPEIFQLQFVRLPYLGFRSRKRLTILQLATHPTNPNAYGVLNLRYLRDHHGSTLVSRSDVVVGRRSLPQHFAFHLLETLLIYSTGPFSRHVFKIYRT